MNTSGKYGSAAYVLNAATLAGAGMFDKVARVAILNTGDARKVEREAAEWLAMFDEDSPFRADLADIVTIAGRMS